MVWLVSNNTLTQMGAAMGVVRLSLLPFWTDGGFLTAALLHLSVMYRSLLLNPLGASESGKLTNKNDDYRNGR